MSLGLDLVGIGVSLGQSEDTDRWEAAIHAGEAITPGPAADRLGAAVAQARADAALPQGEQALARVTVEAGTSEALLAAGALLSDRRVEAVLVVASDRVWGAVALVIARHEPDTRRWPQVYATVEAVARQHDEALAAAGTDPAMIDYVEVGPSESLDGLARTWSEATVGARHTALGTSGLPPATVSSLAAVAKAALCLHHLYLPAAPQAEPSLPEGSGFYRPTDSRPWVRTSRRRVRRVCVVALGVVVLAAATTRGDLVSVDWRRVSRTRLLALGGSDHEGLLRELASARAALLAGTALDVVCDQARRTLPAASRRVVLLAGDSAGMVGELDSCLRDLPSAEREGREWRSPAGSCAATRPLGADGKIALVYPGLFSVYLGLGADLTRCFPGLAHWGERSAGLPPDTLAARVVHPRTPIADADGRMRAAAELVADPATVLTAGLVFATGQTEVLRRFLGLRVDGAFGYCLGEIAVRIAVGCWRLTEQEDIVSHLTTMCPQTLVDAKRIVRRAWAAPATTPDENLWSMRLLFADAEEVRGALDDYDRVFLTHVNAPGEVVIAGDPAQCEALVARLGGTALRIGHSAVVHCPLVERERLATELRRPTSPPREPIEVLSTYRYRPTEETDPRRVAAQVADTLAKTVDFPRLVRAAYDRGYRYFVEVGPGDTCTRWITKILGGREHVAVSADRADEPVHLTVATLAARLISHGAPVDSAIFTAAQGDGRALVLR
ncbi:hypothetical protein [Allokutzneria oryzae]|uniref:Malonyl-CoA:ACP transacylase (MAT) domain-containing protein n=1 Tax=Allokutzneria oryzae TaxID=1378989 RepID=A0ABV5ZXC5_9PSEU